MRTVSVQTLLAQLPAYRDEWVTVKKNQSVRSIIREVLDAHERFAAYYDRIAVYFDNDDTEKICQALYQFCKRNIRYREEPVERQTTALPTGILVRGLGDCKHYASFCGGVLDGINRATGKGIEWMYRFASYKPLDSTPHHVFVVVLIDGVEYWIDPTPAAETTEPIWQQDEKIHTMPLLSNIAGIGLATTTAPTIEQIPGVKMVTGQPDVDANVLAIAQVAKLPLTGNKNLGNFIDWLKLTMMNQLGVNAAYYWAGGQGASKTMVSTPGNGAVDTIWQNSIQPFLQTKHPDVWNSYLTQYHAMTAANAQALASQATSIINSAQQIFTQAVKSATGLDISSFFKPVTGPVNNGPFPPLTTTNNSRSLMYAVLAGGGTYFLMRKEPGDKKYFVPLIAAGAVYFLTRKKTTVMPVMQPTGAPLSPSTGNNILTTGGTILNLVKPYLTPSSPAQPQTTNTTQYGVAGVLTDQLYKYRLLIAGGGMAAGYLLMNKRGSVLMPAIIGGAAYLAVTLLHGSAATSPDAQRKWLLSYVSQLSLEASDKEHFFAAFQQMTDPEISAAYDYMYNYVRTGKQLPTSGTLYNNIQILDSRYHIFG